MSSAFYKATPGFMIPGSIRFVKPDETLEEYPLYKCAGLPDNRLVAW